MIRSSFPRRQQYRRLRRAAASGAAGLAAGAVAVVAASVGALEVAGVLLLVTFGLVIDARRWLRLAARSRIGARSEDDVRRALAAAPGRGVAAAPLAALSGTWRHRQRRDRPDRDRLRASNPRPEPSTPTTWPTPARWRLALPPPAALVPRRRAGGPVRRRRDEAWSGSRTHVLIVSLDRLLPALRVRAGTSPRPRFLAAQESHR